jgi:tRNA threonylcarbamoyladenosine biosynthesis protein TsaE
VTDRDRRASTYGLRLRTHTPEETRAVGAALAAELRAGDVVALTGELGAGKTCLVQGAAVELGVTERVTSPSFLLRRDYRGRMPIIHLDVYRLDTLQEVLDVGYDEVADGAGVTFIEWGDAMAPLLPADYLEVDLRLGDPTAAGDFTEGAEARTLELRPHGADWRRRMGDLADRLAPWTDGKAG